VIEVDNKNTKQWIFIKEFKKKEECESFITENLGSYSQKYKNVTKNGLKIYYRCNLSLTKPLICKSAIYLNIENITKQVLLYKTSGIFYY
jgi:hypothetical protein